MVEMIVSTDNDNLRYFKNIDDYACAYELEQTESKVPGERSHPQTGTIIRLLCHKKRVLDITMNSIHDILVKLTLHSRHMRNPNVNKPEHGPIIHRYQRTLHYCYVISLWHSCKRLKLNLPNQTVPGRRDTIFELSYAYIRFHDGNGEGFLSQTHELNCKNMFCPCGSCAIYIRPCLNLLRGDRVLISIHSDC